MTDVRRLLPDPTDLVDPVEEIAALQLADAAPAHRPYCVANFVASLDGRASIDGGSTGLGDAGDKAIFRALRGVADAVLVGTGTLAAEHYGPLSRDPAVIALRARRELPAQPPLVTISRRGAVPAIPLLDDPDSTLIVYAGNHAELGLDRVRARVITVRRPTDELAPAAVLRDLRANHGVRLLLCEGGPSIFGELLGDGVCDELYLTLASTLAGGEAGPITSRLELDPPLAASLRWALEQDGSLYLRYGLLTGGP